MQVSQVLITDEPDQVLPQSLVYASNTVKECLSPLPYKLYREPDILKLLDLHFPPHVAEAYHALIPYSYKADLAKYCIAYAFGGWIVDISIKMCIEISGLDPSIELVLFRDLGDGYSPYRLAITPIQASLFFVKPQHYLFRLAIEMVLQNVANRFYGLTPICPTGPGLLGKAYAQIGQTNSHVIGDFIPLTPMHLNMNRSYVMPNGEIIALHKNAWFNPSVAPGDISSFNLKGTNNFIDLYKNHSIYMQPTE